MYAARDSRELAERYDSWASDYDDELEKLGYVAPRKAAALLASYLPIDAHILDAGAGTGLVGQALHELRYRRLIGVDTSEGMLGKARQKNVYQALYCCDLQNVLPFDRATFDAVISVGVFTHGHAPAGCLPGLLRIIKPGGYLLLSSRSDFYYAGGLREMLLQLEGAGTCSLLVASDEFVCFPKSNPDVLLKLWLYRLSDPHATGGPAVTNAECHLYDR